MADSSTRINVFSSASVDREFPKCGTFTQPKEDQHWGEFANVQSSSKSMHIVDMDLVALNPKSLELEGPRLHLLTAQQSTSKRQLMAEPFHRDATSIHTIQLLKHNRRIRTIIAASQQQQAESNKWEDQGTRPRIQSLPVTPLLLVQTKRPWTSSSDSTCSGQVEQRDEIQKAVTLDTSVGMDTLTARKLRRRAVATICAHAGYEMSQDSATETLNEILHEYLTMVCKLLRVAVDREALKSCTGFQDVLSQVLQEIGVGDIETLFRFWKVRIKDYHASIQRRNTQLREQHDRLKNPSDVAVSSESKSPRFKEEPFIDIQFPESEQDFEVPPDVPEQPNQPLNLQSLNAMELEDQTRVTATMTEDDNHWYPSAYVKSEAGTEAGSRHEEREGMETDEEHPDQSSLI
ncbi:STAGA complex 65 subunit gamma-like isoform X2 [Acanthaster planci]|uniref:STAGA complex 65 subunit gamma-like isoform X2 n=1 Tax=Acanthaster planci TaxID=133434 RepID=A0A8B7ZME4_ACAPL|nr:STAGA complex 65 subunit gamma-like isoform X2 [Acanthaster planci]